MVYVFLADGFETIEALAPVDMMRRASINVETVGISGDIITSSIGVPVKPDISIDQADFHVLSGIVLPGGGEGTKNLDNCVRLHEFIDYAFENQLMIAAICAAPSILGKKGLLNDVQATAFPTFADYIENYSDNFVVTDKNIITARGAGVSTSFGLEIVRYLKGDIASNTVRKSIQWEK